jgi:sulfur-oxidizing protein SoxY
MTDTDYVKAVHFFAAGNPNPLVAAFMFTPLSPKAAAALRIRLAQSQKVDAIAEISSCELFTASKEVEVTIGGCGG